MYMFSFMRDGKIQHRHFFLKALKIYIYIYLFFRIALRRIMMETKGQSTTILKIIQLRIYKIHLDNIIYNYINGALLKILLNN